MPFVPMKLCILSQQKLANSCSTTFTETTMLNFVYFVKFLPLACEFSLFQKRSKPIFKTAFYTMSSILS